MTDQPDMSSLNWPAGELPITMAELRSRGVDLDVQVEANEWEDEPLQDWIKNCSVFSAAERATYPEKEELSP